MKPRLRDAVRTACSVVTRGPQRTTLVMMAALWTIGVASGTASAETVTLKGRNPTGKPLKDAVIKFTNTTAVGVPTFGAFSSAEISKDMRTVKLDGANLGVGEETTVQINTAAEAGSKYNLVEWSFTDGTKRANSKGDDIFSKMVPGGPTGTIFAGVSIPANQFGYFYQFDRNALFPASPDLFEIIIGNIAPTSVGFFRDTWLVSELEADLPGDLATDAEVLVQDHMTPDLLTGVPGVVPLTWSYSGGSMVATYSPNAFGVGDVSSVLWFTHSLPGEVGGPLDLNAENAALSAGNVTLFTNGTLAPVPEPATLVLMVPCIVLTIVAGLARRGAVRSIRLGGSA